MPTHPLLDLSALILVAVANSTPVLLSMLLRNRWAYPVDGGRTLPDGRPLFGSHKTWRGLIGGTLAGGAAGSLLSEGFATGAAFGLLALIGDLLSAFVKRRLALESGRSMPLLDQLPEAMLPMLLLQDRLSLGTGAILGTAALFTLLDLVAAKVFTFRREPSR